jgi:hypothetical protein
MTCSHNGTPTRALRAGSTSGAVSGKDGENVRKHTVYVGGNSGVADEQWRCALRLPKRFLARIRSPHEGPIGVRTDAGAAAASDDEDGPRTEVNT